MLSTSPERVISNLVEFYFPNAALKEAQAVILDEELLQNRPLVRGLAIDDITTKDCDDTIWLTKTPSGYKLPISFSDVSYFVPPNSALDQAAFQRGFTRYFFAINSPMLPHVLSEDRLSLLANQLKPTITLDIELSDDLQLTSYSLNRTALLPQQYTYEAASQQIYQPTDEKGILLGQSYDLAKKLIQIRKQAGANAWFDEKSGIISSGDNILQTSKSSLPAMLVVQEFMILTNTLIAQFARQHGIPILYKNHFMNPDLIDPIILENSDLDQPSIKQGRSFYSVSPVHHDGLNLEYYAHFTSPIRRYADLINQRNILAFVEDRPLVHSQVELALIAKYLNERNNNQKNEAKLNRVKKPPPKQISMTFGFTNRPEVIDHDTQLDQLALDNLCDLLLGNNDQLLKTRIITWLEQHPSCISEVTKIAAEKHGLQIPNFQTTPLGTKGFALSLTKGIHPTTRAYATDTFAAFTPVSALRLARLDWIRRISGLITDQPTGKLTISDRDLLSNQIFSCLQTFANKRRLNPPLFRETRVLTDGILTAVCSCEFGIKVGDQKFKIISKGEAADPKTAKQKAAVQILIQALTL